MLCSHSSQDQDAEKNSLEGQLVNDERISIEQKSMEIC